jgi:hypothetical protein
LLKRNSQLSRYTLKTTTSTTGIAIALTFMFFAFVSPSNFGGITLHILPLLVYPGYSQMLRRDKSGVSPY